MRLLGLIGGMSFESSAVYYRLINEGVNERLGGLHSARLILHSVDFADIARYQAAGDWDAAGHVLADVAQSLQRGGAEGFVLCTNTMHKVADAITGRVDLPLIHIVDVTAEAVRAAGCRRPLLLATRYTMEDAFYVGRLRDRHGIAALTPDAPGRDTVHRIIYEELCRGIVTEASRRELLAVIGRARATGADGVILGCTELGLILNQTQVAEPVFDTTRLHAGAAIDFSLAN
jgi:aspartate racemase